jgi:UDP-N-acetylglucosamine acyltransferase
MDAQIPLIHPMAAVAPGAELGVGVEIGPYSVIGPNVRIGDRTRVGPQVVIDGHTTIGEDNDILGQANLGGAPQDLSYRDEATQLAIGDRNTIREFVTINRGTVKGGGLTRLGSDSLLMACCHVAHDCELADHVILGNNVLLAGHVSVEEFANISGAAAANQFVTVGGHAYVAGITRMVQDVPPFMIVEGYHPRVRGLNLIGLERSGKSKEEIAELREVYRTIFRTNEPRAQVLERLHEIAVPGGMVARLVDALQRTERGIKGRYRETLRDEYRRLGEERFSGGEAKQ